MYKSLQSLKEKQLMKRNESTPVKQMVSDPDEHTFFST